MRQLKHHEQKLLRKVSLFSWKGEDNLRVAKILRRYHIQNREDYVAYSKICGMVTKLAAKLKVSAVDCRGERLQCSEVQWRLDSTIRTDMCVFVSVHILLLQIWWDDHGFCCCCCCCCFLGSCVFLLITSGTHTHTYIYIILYIFHFRHSRRKIRFGLP